MRERGTGLFLSTSSSLRKS